MNARWLHGFAQRAWYPRSGRERGWLDAVAAGASLALAPAGWGVGAVARRRRASRHASGPGLPPIIVVGNLVAGGTGKTPLVIALARRLQAQEHFVGVICRGHGGTAAAAPLEVSGETDPSLAGDEAVLLARSLGCPVVACRDRLTAARTLAERHAPSVLISDDGLQHTALPRAFEFVVVDALTRFGNGRCLPAGPLREPADAEALRGTDGIRRCFVLRGSRDEAAAAANSPGLADSLRMTVEAVALEPLLQGPAKDATAMSLEWLRGRRVHAVCGIGRPERFFASLATLGAEVAEHAFADHHQYSARDLDFGDALPVLMTAKDAVKCELIDFAARERSFVLGVAPTFDRDPLSVLGPLLRSLP